MNLYVISLGCDKNLVDSEQMLGLMAQNGWTVTDDPLQADTCIVNTCSFILDAQDESVAAILEMAELKESGSLKALIVTGCLAQRFDKEIRDEIPQVDAVLGTNSYGSIVEAVNAALGGDFYDRMDEMTTIPQIHAQRMQTTPAHYGYLKIAEGCAKHCTYCIIPKLRGPYRSVPMEQLIADASRMAAGGVKELILVAQETTLYGVDLYGQKSLPRLLKKLSEIDGIEWIRILYCYPEEITDELIDEIATNDKVVKYIDLPIQHSQDRILKAMGRRTNHDELIALLDKLRSKIPDIALRTTLIEGFPGETVQDHEALMQFVNDMEFDRLGVFSYSKEDGTAAAKMPDQIEDSQKDLWRDEVMELQQEVIFDKNEERIGEVLRVLVDGYMPDDGIYAARSYRDAPDIDGYVFVKTDRSLMSGDMIEVRITEASGYDLIGVPEDEFTE